MVTEPCLGADKCQDRNKGEQYSNFIAPVPCARSRAQREEQRQTNEKPDAQRHFHPGLARTLGNLGRLALCLSRSYTVLCAVLCYDSRRASDGEDSTCLLG